MIRDVGVWLRPVERADWEFILQVRNQDSVRKECHDTEMIPLENHLKYMAKLNEDPHVHQWIIMDGDERIGHFKLLPAEGGAEEGFMMLDRYQGKGLGSQASRLLVEKAQELGIKRLINVIKVGNPASLRVSEKMGYRLDHTIEKDGRPYAHYLVKDL